MHQFRWLFAVCLVFQVIVVSDGCEPSAAALYERPWPCDAELADPGCGTTRDGKPMTCFAAHDLGGTDFCSEACDPAQPSTDSFHFCTASGAWLRSCLLGVANRGCPDGFNCFRTSLDLRDTRGVCIVAPTCRNDVDCSSESPRSTCGATIVREAYDSPYILADHLQCLQRCGTAGDIPCPDDQQCLQALFPDDRSVPDICVPHCTAGGRRCPPNFYCLADAGPAYAAGGSYCLPGVPGRRCSHQQDCMIGDCVDVGDDKVCALDCESDQFCKNLNGPVGTFYCAHNVDTGAAGRCIARGPLAGAYCRGSNDCPENEVCSAFDPYFPGIPKAARAMECHRICSGPGSCANPAGVPFACVAVQGSYGECYPADFGVPCSVKDERCMGALECLGVATDDGQSSSICSRRCDSQSPCAAYTLTGNAYCEDGVCRPLRGSNRPCRSPEQCATGVCLETGVCQ